MSDRWYLKREGKVSGPFSSDQIQHLYDQGKLASGSQIRRENETRWLTSSQFHEEADLTLLGGQDVSSSDVVVPRSIPSSKKLRLNWQSLLWITLSIGILLILGYLIYPELTSDETEKPVTTEENTDHSSSGDQNTNSEDTSELITPESDAVEPQITVDEKSDSNKEPAENETGNSQSQNLTGEELIAKVEPSVANILTDSGSGSGFLIQPGILATNKHVINNAFESDIKVRFPSAEDDLKGPYDVRVVYKHPNRDLALLEVETDLPSLVLKKNYSLRKGQDVIAIGNPGGIDYKTLENAVSKGIMSTNVSLKSGNFFQLTIAINHGNSGGPVIDSDGEVLGVITLTENNYDKDGLAYAIPVSEVESSLKEFEKLSGQEKDQVRSNHRLQTAYNLLDTASKNLIALMALELDTLQDESKKDQNATYYKVIYNAWKNYKDFDEKKLIAQISGIQASNEYDDPVKDQIYELYESYLDIESVYESKNSAKFQQNYQSLKEKYEKLSKGLKIRIGN